MLRDKISPLFHKIIDAEFNRLVLWVPVFVGFGAFLFITYFDGTDFSFAKIIFPLLLFFFSLGLYYQKRESYQSLIFAALAALLFGFVYSFSYQKIFNNYTQITGRVFVDVRGRVAEVSKTYNAINSREGLKILVRDPVFYKQKNAAAPFKKFSPPREISEKMVLKNFMNVLGYQDIDVDFLERKKNYQQVEWQKVEVEKEVGQDGSQYEGQGFGGGAQDGGSGAQDVEERSESHFEDEEIFPNPPHKILVIANGNAQNLEIGDEIFFRASLAPPKQKQFLGDFDYGFSFRAKGVGAQGYVSGEIEIVSQSKSHLSSFDEFIEKTRGKIQEIILRDLPRESGNIAAALLMGNQNLISKDVMNDIRNSGLAHLISISGLHLSLAAGIFFFTFRLLLAQSSYLTLNFNIKKIAAIAAIISSFFYLKISGSPVPAVRSFIAVLLVMAAILFDRKIHPLRSIAFAIFVVTLFNPYNIFSISFQLSFAAILALIVFDELWKKLDFVASKGGRFKKFSLYFFEMILISTFTQLANTPFLIYYFSDVSVYGALSNMVAIPLTSFTTMPLGFASFFLMPLGLEKLVLVPMGITIDWVVDIAHFVANLNNSHFYLPQMPKYGLGLAIFGGLIFCFCSNYLKPLGALIFLVSFASLVFIKQPDFLIDGEARFFAIYSKKNGLVFSKDLRPSKKRDLWMQKMNEKEFKSFADFSDESLKGSGIDCSAESCAVDYRGKKLFFIFKRMEIEKICENNFDLVVNMTKKYALPQCVAKNNIKIDNDDLFLKGAHFLYFENGKIKIKTAN